MISINKNFLFLLMVIISLAVVPSIQSSLSSKTISTASQLAYAQQQSPVIQNKQQHHPNIALFLVDNEPYRGLGTYGGGLGAQTPNTDKFAKEGIKFTRAYATNTYCSPTRASLMTGLMPSQN
jgi:hypothetical protein